MSKEMCLGWEYNFKVIYKGEGKGLCIETEKGTRIDIDKDSKMLDILEQIDDIEG